MPDRYWVGGTASWDGTAGTKWSATSGGPGGASVPTSADDVFFDAASGAGTVTIAAGNTGARSINCTGFTGTITGTADISIAGSITLVATMTWSHTGQVNVTGTGTITTAGRSFSTLSINGTSITVNLGDALNTSTRSFQVRGSSTFNTAGFNITTGLFDITNSAVVNLSSSNVTVTQFSINATSATINAGTSTINFVSGGSITATVNPITLHNVNFNTSAVSATAGIAGQVTVNNLSLTAPSTAGLLDFRIGASGVGAGRITINGNFSTSGTAGNRRVLFTAQTIGYHTDLVINGTTSLTDIDFRDMRVIGTAAPISGTRIGDLRGNIDIRFDNPKRVFRIGTGNWSDNQWSNVSGGAVSTDNFPLAQDTAVFNNSTTTGTHTMNSAIPYCGTVDMSARSNALTLSIAASQTVYGDWINGAGITISSSQTLVFAGRTTQTITSAGRSFGSTGLTVNTFGGFVELADAFTTGGSLTVSSGNLNTNNFNFTFGTFSAGTTVGPRTVDFGTSTVTMGTFDGGAISPPTSTFITDNANFIMSGSLNYVGEGLRFNSVTFTGSNITISGNNTFNNLTINAPTSDGISQYTIANDQTVTGTLTVSGATPVRRVFFRTSGGSATIGFTRTLNVANLSINDCDFRDITIAGAAAGSSPTRVGNCGGNSGINFPAPKTVYWNLAGTQNWSATGWALTSGGSPDVNNFPLAQDTAIFDNAGAAGTVTIGSWNIGTFNASARTTPMTLAYTGSPIVYGNWTFGTGITSSSSPTILTFSGRSNQTITSNGVAFNCSIDIRCVATVTVSLADALTSGSLRQLSLTNGIFDAVTFNVTFGTFRTNSALGRTLRMGTGLWTLSGTGTVWDYSQNFTANSLIPGTANILLSDTSTTARTFAAGNTYYNRLTIGGTTGTSTLTFTGGGTFTELASTKTVAHTINFGINTYTFGKWSVTGSAGNVVTLAGTGAIVISGACVSGVDYLAMGSIFVPDTSPGEFYAGPNSTGTAGAPVYRTAKPADSVRYWVGGTGNWSDTARWSTSSGGAGGASVPRSHDNVIFDAASNATSYTATINTVTGGARCKSLTVAGPASGSVTIAGTARITIHDNISLPATGLNIFPNYTGDIILSGSQTGRTINSNGHTLFLVTIDGIGSEWILSSAFNGSNLTVNNGTFRTANFAVNIAQLFSGQNFVRAIYLGSSTVSVSGANPVSLSFDIQTAELLTFDAGTSTINCSTSAGAIGLANKSFHNFTFTNTGGAGIIQLQGPPGGSSTFNNLTIQHLSSSGIRQFQIQSAYGITVNGTFTFSSTGDATRRCFLSARTQAASVVGFPVTISCAAFSGSDVDFRDIVITGAAAPISGTRLGNCGGNSGITFPGAKTVYWNLAAGGNWNATAWANTSGGTPVANNFPLAQDECLIEDTGLNAGSTITIPASYNIGTINMEARFSNSMTIAVNANVAIHGSWFTGSAVTISGTSTLTFAGRTTQIITCAGKTFTTPITISNVTGTLRMNDAFSSSAGSNLALDLNSGTLDTNNNSVTLTASGFLTSGSLAKTLIMGTSTWTIAGTSLALTTTAAANTTITGTNTINLNHTGNMSVSFIANLPDVTLNIAGSGATTLTVFVDQTSPTRLLPVLRDLTATRTATSNTTISLQSFGGGALRLVRFTGKGEPSRILTLASTGGYGSPFSFINIGPMPATNTSVDYLRLRDVRGYNLNNTWYAGNNSINEGTLGWIFEQTPPTLPNNGNFFMVF